MGEFDNLIFKLSDGLARITLSNPPFNAINLGVARELREASRRCAEARRLRAVLVTGSGKTFSVGGDLKAFAKEGSHLPQYLKKVTSNFHAAIDRFTRLSVPVITAVNGLAAGGGFSLACIGDIVIAAESASFVMSYTHVGLTPDGGSTFILPRLVGLRRAQELVFLNRKVTATEALQWGLITSVVPDIEFSKTIAMLSDSLSHGPTMALGVTKRLFAKGLKRQSLKKHMMLESLAMSRVAAGEDGREGICAFLQKRRPVFQGR